MIAISIGSTEASTPLGAVATTPLVVTTPLAVIDRCPGVHTTSTRYIGRTPNASGRALRLHSIWMIVISISTIDASTSLRLRT
jgi:hypothetical protein